MKGMYEESHSLAIGRRRGSRQSEGTVTVDMVGLSREEECVKFMKEKKHLIYTLFFCFDGILHPPCRRCS